MKKIAVLFTCFNRCKTTKRAIQKIDNEKGVKIDFFVIDDKSTDNTLQELKKLNKKNLHILQTKGNYYYSKSMNYGMNYLLNLKKQYDYLLMVNDDVDFYHGFLEKMIDFQTLHNCIAIGACEDEKGKLSYGGILFHSKFSSDFERIGPEKKHILCNTFNGNCVLIPYKWFKVVGAIDNHYVHSFGDFDYGLRAKKKGIKIYQAGEYLGECDLHENIDKWCNPEIPFHQRWKALHRPTGMPPKETFHLEKRHCGLMKASFHYCTIYLRCLFPQLWNRRNQKYLKRV